MWLPVDLVLAALLSSAFKLAWVAERGWAFGRRRSFRPRPRLLLRTGAGAITRAGVFPRRRVCRERGQARTAPRIPVPVAQAVGGRRSKPLQRLAAGYCYVRAHSAGRRARRPRARAQPVAADAYAPIWLLPRIVRTCHDTATCPRQNCLHAQRRPRRAHGDNLHPCRRKSVATPAFRRSPARLNHRHVPGKHSVARTLAPQRHALASQRHAGVQLRPRGGHLGPPSQPAHQRRPCRSSWAGAQPARPTVVGALLTPCDQGRHDG